MRSQPCAFGGAAVRVDYRSVARRVRRPPRLLAQLAVQRMAKRLNIEELDVPLLLDDLADSDALAERRASGIKNQSDPTRPPRVGWVISPPGPGSGGHTTLFRMVRAAKGAGFDNTLLLYRRYAEDLDRYASILRSG